MVTLQLMYIKITVDHYQLSKICIFKGNIKRTKCTCHLYFGHLTVAKRGQYVLLSVTFFLFRFFPQENWRHIQLFVAIWIQKKRPNQEMKECTNRQWYKIHVIDVLHVRLVTKKRCMNIVQIYILHIQNVLCRILKYMYISIYSHIQKLSHNGFSIWKWRHWPMSVVVCMHYEYGHLLHLHSRPTYV